LRLRLGGGLFAWLASSAQVSAYDLSGLSRPLLLLEAKNINQNTKLQIPYCQPSNAFLQRAAIANFDCNPIAIEAIAIAIAIAIG
jgi:hypothetical protein